MKRPKKRPLVSALALASLAVAAPAAAGVGITSVDTSGYPEVRVTVVVPTSAAQPRLQENGLPVFGLRAVNLGRAKSIVLAVDRSESMQGASLADATAAARDFVATKLPTDRVEVIGFGRQAFALTRFSSSTADADAALRGVVADSRSGTALWDAVVQAAHALQHEDQPGHVIIVVTDGRDVSSSATLADAVAAARRAHASVYAIAIAGPSFTPGPLRTLAAQTGGAYREAASSAGLSALYASIARTLAHTWQLSYVTAARPDDRAHLTVSAPAAGSSERTIHLPNAGVGPAPVGANPTILPRSAWTSKTASLALALAVGLLVLLAVGFAASARSGSWLKARLAPHLGSPARRTKAKRRREGRTLLRGMFSATERAFANVKQFRALQQLLTRADLPLLAAELLYLSIGAGLVAGVLAALVGAPTVIIAAFIAAGAVVPSAWVASKARRRIKAFDNQLPDLLITIAASLKAGHSFRHAIQAVVDEGADPAAKEFRRVLTATRLGRPMDEALAEVSERIGSKNLSFVLTAVTIQRQIGGSLAGLFDMVAETVRQRQQFARKIRSLTAMGRMSAYVLAGLPFCVAVLISLISPAYMAPLWHSTTGHELVGAGLVMLAFGSLILKKIVSFKG